MITRNFVRDLFIEAEIGIWVHVRKAIDDGVINVNIVDSSGVSLLEVAVDNGNHGAVKYMLEKKVDPNQKWHRDGTSALHNASFSGNLESVQCLLEYGAAINAVCPTSGRSALFVASATGYNIEIVKHLVFKGADKELKCFNGYTPLMIAASYGLSHIVQFLLDEGCDRTAEVAGNTCLHLAARHGRLGVVMCLIRNGVNLDATNDIGQRAVDVASSIAVKYALRRVQ